MRHPSQKLRPVAQPLASLDEIFESCLYRIPDYQRGYAWGEKEYGAFWSDLLRMDESRIHYTGQITVRRVPEAEYSLWADERSLISDQELTPYYLVDGQQRLTTSVLILKCLTERMDDDARLRGLSRREIEDQYLYKHTGQLSRVFIFGYSVEGACYEFLKEQILGQKSVEAHQADSVYAMNLKDARDYFSCQVEGLSMDSMQVIFSALTQRLRFNWNELVPELDEFVVFETMNNRGKKVSDFELLKNRLIHLTSLLPESVTSTDKRRLRHHVNSAWAKAYEELGRKRNDTLNSDSSFLNNHSILYFSRSWEASKFLLDEHFTQDQILDGHIGLDDIERYVASIPLSAKAWRFIHDPLHSDELPDPVRENLVRLQRLDYGAFTPLLMAVLQHPAASAPLKADLVRASEAFRFSVASICRRKVNTGEPHFQNLAFRVFMGHQTIEGAVQEINHWTSNHFDLERAISEFENRFRWGNKGFYAWHDLRFLLFEYEQEVRQEFGMAHTKLDWQEFNEEKRSDFVTVEHILPEKPRPGDWQSFADYDEDQLHRLTHSLGNLLPLSQSRNSHLSNRAFRTKCGDDGKIRGYSKGCCSEIKISVEQDWTPKEIIDRGLAILEFIERRWSLDFGTKEQRHQFLGLSFMPEELDNNRSHSSNPYAGNSSPPVQPPSSS
jgi:hypothetical protein